MIWSSDWLTEWCCFIIVNHSVVGRDYETNWNTLLFVQCWSAAWWISIECWIRNCKAILVKQNNMWRIPIRRFRRRHCAELRFFYNFFNHTAFIFTSESNFVWRKGCWFYLILRETNRLRRSRKWYECLQATEGLRFFYYSDEYSSFLFNLDSFLHAYLACAFYMWKAKYW